MIVQRMESVITENAFAKRSLKGKTVVLKSVQIDVLIKENVIMEIALVKQDSAETIAQSNYVQAIVILKELA